MPFAHVETKENKSNFQKTAFLDLGAGQHLIRVLQPEATLVYTHYVRKTSLLCLGDDCPICKQNKAIIMENPENFREVEGYSPRAKRYFVNVLDRTMVKVCPECETENKKAPNGVYSATCRKCNSFINQIKETQSNKVKLWGFGVQVAELLNSYEQANNNPITSYDLMLMVTGVDKEKKTNPVPMFNNNDVFDIDSSQLFDTTSGVIKLSGEEIIQLRKGVSLKDIFTGRKAGAVSVESEPSVAVDNEEIARRAKEIFGV